MTLCYNKLDILGIIILTTNNNEIFETTGNKQIISCHETQIACAQKGTLARISQKCPKRPLGFGGIIPITLSNALSSQPYFSDLISGTRCHSLRIDNSQSLARR